ncbi:HipA domain-containing protein [Veronia pacifica]|uniref:HIPA protein n=1 Tax=Veronia pacifica TaxID=1080227 RepID=A0A1C3EBM9_9GAMM|nr:HipA domain-containing protein [Veronia pacifica]ODA30639.1 HIPA protein [Veronia pacifica]
MAGSSKRHQLDIIAGTQVNVGTLSLPVGTANDFTLDYDPEWARKGFPISPHLPLEGGATSRSINNFLRNLFPEGAAFDEMVSNTTISKGNTYALIKQLGAETSGLLSFRSAESDVPATGFREVPDHELVERLERDNAPLVFWDGKVRLSVAGVQDKLNLLHREGKWGFGEGALCSTHIMKFETGKVPCIAINEYFCMRLASTVGIEAAKVELATFGTTRTLVIERFDRRYLADRDIVIRSHLIDGCQATDLPPEYKYERQHGDAGEGKYIRDGVSFPKLFKVETTDNADTRMRLLRWMAFNLAIFNYDAHGKNVSFFVKRSGLALAPFYDLVNIEALARQGAMRNGEKAGRDLSIPRVFAMSIGDWPSDNEATAGNFEPPITAYHLADFARETGFRPAQLSAVVGDTARLIHSAVKAVKDEVIALAINDEESEHIAMCADLITTECNRLIEEAGLIEEMTALL